MRSYHRLAKRFVFPKEYLEAIHAEQGDLLEITVSGGAIHVHRMPSKEQKVYKSDIAWLDEAYRFTLAHRLREDWALGRSGEHLAYAQVDAGLTNLIKEKRYHAIDAAVQNLEPGRLNPWIVRHFIDKCQPIADQGLLPSWNQMLQKIVRLAYPEREELPYIAREVAERPVIDPELI